MLNMQRDINCLLQTFFKHVNIFPWVAVTEARFLYDTNNPVSATRAVILGLSSTSQAYQWLACENIHFSSLLATRDISRGGTSATQWQKFRTDDVKFVPNPTLIGYCLRMTDKRQKATKVKCKHDESITKQSIFVEYNV